MNEIDKLELSAESATSGETGDNNECELPHLRTKSRKKKVIKSALIANLACIYSTISRVQVSRCQASRQRTENECQ